MTLNNNNAVFFAGVVVGGLVGASLALLLAPSPGQETRAQLKTKGLELKDLTVKQAQKAGHRAQDQVAVWQEKGKGALEKGRHSAVEAISHGKDNLKHAIKFNKETVSETVADEVEQPV